MAFSVCRPKPGGLYPSVDLGRRDAGVTQHLLDRPQVRTALEEMGGEGMTQGVRVYARLRRGVARPYAQAPPDIRGREPSAALGHEQRRLRIGAHQRGPRALQIARDGAQRRLTRRHEPGLGTLSLDPDLLL